MTQGSDLGPRYLPRWRRSLPSLGADYRHMFCSVMSCPSLLFPDELWWNVAPILVSPNNDTILFNNVQREIFWCYHLLIVTLILYFIILFDNFFLQSITFGETNIKDFLKGLSKLKALESKSSVMLPFRSRTLLNNSQLAKLKKSIPVTLYILV